MSASFIMTTNGISLFCKNKSYAINRDHVNYDLIVEAIKDNASEDDLYPLVDLKALIVKKTYGDTENYFFFKEENDSSIYLKLGYLEDDILLDGSLAKRLIIMIKHQMPVENLLEFVKKLYKNPSYTSVHQLFGFLEKNKLPITASGNFLAYKKVGYDYKDLYSGNFDNSIGTSPRMNRNEVEDNPQVTCSFGLHACSFEYLEHFGSNSSDENENFFNRVMVVEVDPSNVVSVPEDYNNAKIRTCGYTVIDEIPNDIEGKISDWFYGKHEEGWIMKTFTKVSEFYTSFYESKRIKDFDQLPESVIKGEDITSALIERFVILAKKTFPEITPIGPLTQASIDSALMSSIDSPKTLMGLLSQVDTKVLVN